MDVVVIAYVSLFALWRLWDWFTAQVGASYR